jgi:hypothetical protein
VNKGKKVDKQDLCEWTAKALLKSLNCKNIKSGFKKTGIWLLNSQVVAIQMAPSQGFEEGQESFDENQVDYHYNIGGGVYNLLGVVLYTRRPFFSVP